MLSRALVVVAQGDNVICVINEVALLSRYVTLCGGDDES